MRIATLRTLKDRLEADARLAEWGICYEQASPQIVLGYKAVRTADEWPFVALVPVKQLRPVAGNPRITEMSVAIVSGIRLVGKPLPDAEAGLEMADALAEVIAEILIDQPLIDVDGRVLALAEIELTDTEAKHPNYEYEQLFTWRAPE